MRVTGLDRGQEGDEGRAVVGLGEPLAGDEGAFVQDPVRVEEPVGRHQVHARRGVPAGEQQLEEARDRRLADGDRAGDADDEGGRVGLGLSEEGVPLGGGAAAPVDVELQ